MESGQLAYDAIIVGGGPAGGTCALWLKLLGHRPVVVEKRDRLGGLKNDLPYPNHSTPVVALDTVGMDVAKTIHESVQQQHVDVFLRAEATNLRRRGACFAADVGPQTLHGIYLVLATGVRPVSGGIEPSADVVIGPGGSLAATDFRSMDVAILGGGDAAFESYDWIRSCGAKSVKIFAREIRARTTLVTRVPAADIQLGWYAVDAARRQVGERTFDKIVVLYGWEPQLPVHQNLPIGLSTRGFVAVNNCCETNQENVFAIGELAQRAHPCCVTAMADGVVVANQIQQRLEARSRPQPSGGLHSVRFAPSLVETS